MKNKEEEFEKEVVNYFKGKDIQKADKLLFETAINNFKAGYKKGFQAGKQEGIEEITELEEYLAELEGEILLKDNNKFLTKKIKEKNEEIEELKQKLKGEENAKQTKR